MTLRDRPRGHGGPGIIANTHLEGSYTERYPATAQNRHGMARVLSQWGLSEQPGRVEQATARYWATMERHQRHIGEHGEDLPEIRDWAWHA